MGTVAPGWRGFAIAVVRHGTARSIVVPTIWMVIRVEGVVRARSPPFIFTFSSSSVILFSLLSAGGGVGRGCLKAVDPVDLRVGGQVTVSFTLWILFCLWVGCLGHHGVGDSSCGV